MITDTAHTPDITPAAHDVALDLRDLTRRFPDGDTRITALDRVDLRLPRGSIAAITGPSGSGKSTLLAVAGTLLRPDSGSVHLNIDGDPVEVTGLSRARLAAIRLTHIGFVFQQPNLIPSLTATEQLEAVARLTSSTSWRPARARRVRERAHELLDAVGLSEHAGRLPGQMSGGQRQRVNIARALMNRPDVLLVDEPTSALDSERGAAIIDLIVELTRERNTGTLLVTHDLTQLDHMDNTYEMVDGRLSIKNPSRPTS